MSRYVSGYSPNLLETAGHYVVLSDDAYILVGQHGVPTSESSSSGLWRPISFDEFQSHEFRVLEQHNIGLYQGAHCIAVRVASDNIPLHTQFEPLRNLLVGGRIADDEFAMVGAGMQVFTWDRAHQFCGQCGQPTSYHPQDRARVCESCKLHFYPRISPCVIGLITRGEECLLAKHAMSRGNFYSPLAGFIEPGETVENALRREVLEEVSIAIKNIRYFASQPWPFPGQLMLGFHADYESGEIQVDGVEIIDAKWWSWRDLPSVPPTGSLSGQLIKYFVEQHN